MAFTTTSKALKSNSEIVTQLRKNCFVRDKTVTLLWGNYPYEIELSRIKKQIDLIWWIYHLCGKRWMDARKMRFFVLTVCSSKKWDFLTFQGT